MNKETPEQTIDRLCKRHMAKLLSRLQEIDTPVIILSEIKKQMYFLRDDLVSEHKSNVRKFKNDYISKN